MTEPIEEPHDDTQESRSIPIVEERLRLDVRTSERHVRVVTRAERERVTLTEELEHSRVRIDRVPCDRIVEAPPAVREEDGVTILSVVEEELVVTRRLRLVEEIRMVPVTETEIVERTETLRRLEPHVRRDEDESIPPER